MKKTPSYVLSALVAVAVLPASAQENNNLKWSVTPYIWAPHTTADINLRDQNIGTGDVSFNDLLDKLDAAFMVHVEAGRGKWSVFSDLTYLSTSDETSIASFSVDTNSKQLFLDAVVAYWPNGIDSSLNVFGGVRYSDFDARFRISSGNTVVSEPRLNRDYTDVLIGMRYYFDFSDRWALIARGDASFGPSEGTTLLRANLAWKVGKRRQNSVLFGYEYKQAEFAPGLVEADLELLTVDFTYHGPMVGINFRF
jgi:hypothetical protein